MLINVNSLQIEYIAEGKENAPVLLLIHGWGCNGEVYRGVIDHLSGRYRVIVPDLPGFGGSGEPKTPWGVDEYADFITAFCGALGVEECLVFGHSLGGRIAIKLLSRGDCPLRVSRVILTGSAGIKPKRSLKARVRGRIYKAGRAILSLSPMKALFPRALDNMRNKHGSPDYLAASPMMRQCLVKIVNEDLTPLLPLVKPPVLLIWGALDDQTPLADGRLMEQRMPEAGLAVIEGAGHYAFLEQGALFLRILDAYL